MVLMPSFLTEDLVLALPAFDDAQIWDELQEHPAVFEARFSRCQGLLCCIACRVLGGHSEVEEAVGRCWRFASLNPPKFKYEGEFRSWLIRILIDEALAIRKQKNHSKLEYSISQTPIS